MLARTAVPFQRANATSWPIFTNPNLKNAIRQYHPHNIQSRHYNHSRESPFSLLIKIQTNPHLITSTLKLKATARMTDSTSTISTITPIAAAPVTGPKMIALMIMLAT